jgi:Na+-driven multidrug efflux pump
MGVALAAATLVGNALGREDPEDAARWGWNAAALGFVYGIALSLVLVPLADPILGLFLTDSATRALAWMPMVLWASVIGFDAVGMVLMNALLGAGDTRRSMWITVIAQWVFFLPIAWLAGPVLGFGLTGVWAANGLYRLGQALYCAHAWRSRRWVGIKI